MKRKRARSIAKRTVKPRGRSILNPIPRYKMITNPQVSKVAQQMRCEVTYCEYGVSLDPGAGVAASYVFAANGLFDPNITGVGHQPMGYDQLAALWNQYVVVGGVIKVSFSNADGTQSQLVGITLKDSASTTPDPRQYIEWGNTTWDTVGPLSSSPVKVLKHKFDIGKFAAQDIYNEQSFTGSVATNPSNTLHLVVWCAPVDALSNLNPVYANVEIMYDVIFRSPGATTLS